MEQTEDFDRSEWPLPEIRVEIWQGFLFINFDRDAAPLSPRLTGLDELFGRYRLSELRATGDHGVLEREQLEALLRAGDGHVPRAGYAFHAAVRIAGR